MSKRAIIFALLSLCLVFTACAEPGAVDAASVFGTVEGDTYENTLLSIGCKLKGWHYNSKEEMMTLNNNKQTINDCLGNPIEIGIAVIWKVVDTTKAVFDVDNYKEIRD